MSNIKIFEDKSIRTQWNDEEEDWYFSVVDVVEVLTQSKNHLTARKYWNKLKQRLKEEGNETVTNCHQLKLVAEDGKLRLIQSIPSPKAEPFKMWLATVGSERLDEIADPEKQF